MTDLELIVQLRPDALLPELAELATARSRLAQAIAAETGGAARVAGGVKVTGHQRLRQWAGRSWPPVVVLVGVVMVAAVVAAFLLTRPSRVTPAKAKAGLIAAAQFLGKAAKALNTHPAQPGSSPRPNQFVYAEAESAAGSLYQIWQSADGAQPGLIRNGQGRFPLAACTVAQAQATGCAESAGFLPQMPTRPARLRAFLKSIGVIQPDTASTPGWAANDLGKAVDSLMSNTYLLPAQRAALFRFMAQTPGFVIVQGVHDAIGRPGVAVQWTYEGGTAQIILNPTTYAYLGDRTTYRGENPAQFDGEALVKLAYVDKAGQQPRASRCRC